MVCGVWCVWWVCVVQILISRLNPFVKKKMIISFFSTFSFSWYALIRPLLGTRHEKGREVS